MELTAGLNDQLMAMAAHRYCLGQQSYIVGACLEWLRETWSDFDWNTRRVMVRDTVEALMDGRAGSPTIDAPCWKDFGLWAWSQLPEDDQGWVIDSVAHKGKPWPLEPWRG